MAVRMLGTANTVNQTTRSDRRWSSYCGELPGGRDPSGDYFAEAPGRYLL